jgi:hypothetical protein
MQLRRPQNLVVGAIFGAFALAAFSYPFLLVRSRQPPDPSLPLQGSAVMRGAFMNTGTVDVGPDLEYAARQKAIRDEEIRAMIRKR